MRSLIIVAVLAVLAGGGFLLINRAPATSVTSATATSTSMVQTAWVEVVKEPVYQDVGTTKTPLTSGATVAEGTVLETGATGAATVHFPDGSIARMDADTSLTLSSVSFNPTDNSMVVKIGLTIGRVWSKVIGLATPASSWEVQTSNTVATVRGTAFGVGHKKDGSSWVLGSEHTVTVAPVDPKTGQKIVAAEVLLNEGKLIQLSDADARTTTSSSTLAKKITPIVGEFKTNAWIKASEEADKTFDTQLEQIKAKTPTTDVNDVIRKKDAQTQIILKQKSEVVTPPVTPPSPPTEKKGATETPKVAPEVKETVSSSGSSPTTETRTIVADRKLDGLVEGDTVQFRVMDGSKEVSGVSTWSVTGPVGSISRAGLFTALLGSEVSEFGVSIGFVNATLSDGTVLKGPLMYVSAKVEASTVTNG